MHAAGSKRGNTYPSICTQLADATDASADRAVNTNGLDLDQLRDDAGRLLVRRAINRDDWISDAILDIAAGDREDWSTEDWNTLLSELQTCRLRLADWLDLNT